MRLRGSTLKPSKFLMPPSTLGVARNGAFSTTTFPKIGLSGMLLNLHHGNPGAEGHQTTPAKHHFRESWLRWPIRGPKFAGAKPELTGFKNFEGLSVEPLATPRSPADRMPSAAPASAASPRSADRAG